MSKFYGENAPSSTALYAEFANNYLKQGTLPTVEPLVCHVSNTWQNSKAQTPSDQMLKDWQTANEVHLVITDDGDVKVQLVSTPAQNEIAIIDWVSFTFKRYTFMDSYVGLPEDQIDDICIYQMGECLDSIFGFKVGKKRKNGKNFYESCFELTNHEGVIVGDLCIGGQANSILVMVSGQGCLMGDYGWQERLYEFLRNAKGGKITRLDLAHDDLDGTYLDIDDLNERESAGEFYYFGKPARVTWYGDWKYMDRDKLGRTLQIGCRSSDKLLRAYEKGKQLGSADSDWLRLEVELKAKHTHIPFDAILNPSDYFINLYPCFKDLFKYDDQKQSRIEYVKRTVSIKIDKGIDILRHQFGRWLGFFREWFGDDETCMNALAHAYSVPKRFDLTMQDWERVHPDFRTAFE